MSQRPFVFLFAIALVLDLVFARVTDGSVFVPYLMLSTLPALFLFTKTSVAGSTGVIAVLFLWIAGNLNLGIVTFSVGILYVLERWVIPTLFHTSTWQALVVAALGLPVMVGVATGLTLLLSSSTVGFTAHITISTLLSTALSLAILFVLRKRYV